MLENPKKQDGTLGYTDMLHTEIATRRAVLRTYAELNKSEVSHKKRMREFVRTFPKYVGKPEKVFEWIAFKEWETGVFFTKLLKRFSQEKYEEGRKQECLAKKQKSNEDTREYNT